MVDYSTYSTAHAITKRKNAARAAVSGKIIGKIKDFCPFFGGTVDYDVIRFF
jgi:hypothetical protein